MGISAERVRCFEHMLKTSKGKLSPQQCFYAGWEAGREILKEEIKREPTKREKMGLEIEAIMLRAIKEILDKTGYY